MAGSCCQRPCWRLVSPWQRRSGHGGACLGRVFRRVCVFRRVWFHRRRLRKGQFATTSCFRQLLPPCCAAFTTRAHDTTACVRPKRARYFCFCLDRFPPLSLSLAHFLFLGLSVCLSVCPSVFLPLFLLLFRSLARARSHTVPPPPSPTHFGGPGGECG